MLINLRNALMTGKRLPYDAEVEYLESSGTQYIDTLVNADSNLSVEITMANAGTPWTNVNPMGAILATPRCRHHLNFDSTLYTNGINYYFGNGDACHISTGYKPADGEIFTFKVDAASKTFTLGSFLGTLPNGTFDTGLSYWLFGRNGTTPPHLGSLRIYSAKLWNGTTLVRDYIPVRVGTVGYLYDRVSGKLFGNAGTGDFVIGQDVVPVEWLQSSGRQWIDTGVVPAANDTYTVETRKNNASQDNASFGLAGCVYCFSNGFVTGNGTFWGHPAVGVGGTAGVNPLGDTNWHTIVASPTSVSVDGVALGDRTSNAQSPLSTVKLFARGNNSASGGVAKQYNGMISHVFVNRGGSDLRKFYAVRVGTDATSWEGAMMDVLTRRIYRNAGTGAFTYGNDLKYPIPSE